MTNEAKVMNNDVKKVDKLNMKMGYLEMAMINLNIVSESFNAENEAEQTQYALLGN